MRFFITFCCLVTSLNLYAQTSNQSLFGSWVKTHVEYKNGEELPDEKQVKSAYLKYIFSKADDFRMCFDYRSKGMEMTYGLDGNVLEIKNSNGYLTNSFLVEKANSEQLVLLQRGNDGFNGADCLRYYFEPEILYQKSIPLTSNDLVSIKGTDTVYKASQKIFAMYKGEGDFHDYLTRSIPEFSAVEPTDAHFVATYIVNEFGIADSLHILEQINPDFDKQFIKAFNKARKNWQPATLKGKNVAVQMTQEFRFISSANFLPNLDYSSKGKEAIKQGQWDQAVYYFDKALEKFPDSIDNLYNRAVCKIALGNKTGACKDLNAIKLLGSTVADELIRKNCK